MGSATNWLQAAARDLDRIMEDDDATNEELRDEVAQFVAAVPAGEILLLDKKRLRRLLIEWHVDEATSESEAADYADRLINRMNKECSA